MAKIQKAHIPDERIDQDIIFIHSIGVKWEQTWCLRDFSEPWINTLLPNEFPAARILSWGCDLAESSKFEYDTLLRMGKEFLRSLQTICDTPPRPIVFVAHSMGGVVLKAALAEAQHSNAAILEATRGIIFFGTPRFTDANDWVSFSQSICAKRTEPTSPKKFAKLVYIDDDFSRLHDNRQFRVSCFFEDLPVYRQGILVPRKYATMRGQENYALYADHFSMTRFDAAEDPDFRAFCDHLARIYGVMDQNSVPDGKNGGSSEMSSSTGDLPSPDGREDVLREARKSDATFAELRSTIYALALEDQGQYFKAETVYREALEKFEQAPTAYLKWRLFCKDKLANILCLQGKYNEAEALCRDVMKVRRRASDADHAGMLSTARILALSLRFKGRSKEAYDLLVENLECIKNMATYSLEHINTVSLLAKLLKDRGYYEFSEYLSREVVCASITQLGIQHPWTLNRISDLSNVLCMREKFQYAEGIGRFAVDSLERQLGVEHPDALHATERLASYLRFQGRVPEACLILESILPLQQIKLGRKHPAVLCIMCGLAACYVLLGRIDKGRDLLEKAYKIQVINLSPSHPDTVWTSNALEKLNLVEHSTDEIADMLYTEEELSEDLREFLSRPSRPADRTSEGSKASEQVGISPTINLSVEDLKNLRISTINGENPIMGVGLEEKLAINDNGGYCGTLVQAASYSGNIDVVRWLLERGADVSLHSGIFHTPLKAASLVGHTNVVRALLDYAALPADRESGDSIRSTKMMSALEVASSFGRDEVVRLLLERGADPDTSSPLFGSVLHQAASTGHAKVVKELLRAGANANARNDLFKTTPLQVAANAGNEATIKLLMDHGSAGSPELSELEASPAAGQLEVLELLMRNAAEYDPGANTEARLDDAAEELTKRRTSPTNTFLIKPSPKVTEAQRPGSRAASTVSVKRTSKARRLFPRLGSRKSGTGSRWLKFKKPWHILQTTR